MDLTYANHHFLVSPCHFFISWRRRPLKEMVLFGIDKPTVRRRAIVPYEVHESVHGNIAAGDGVLDGVGRRFHHANIGMETCGYVLEVVHIKR